MRAKSVRNLVKNFLQAQRGASLPMMAAAIIPLLGAIGGAVDLANVYMVRSQLRDAVDAAALAGGRLYFATDRDTQVENYFRSNMPALLTGNTLRSLTITPAPPGGGARLTVTAEVDVSTFLIRVLGMETVTTKATATVERRSNAMELVLALDNTLSMDQTDGGTITRIEALKTATRDFVGVLYGGNTTNPNLYISMMPYTSYVNVGKLLLDEQAATGRTYLENISGYSYNPANPLGWKGCVDEPPTDNTIDETTDPTDDARWATAFDTKEFLPGVSGAPLFRPSLVPSFGVEWVIDQLNGNYCGPSPEYWRDGELVPAQAPDPNCVPTPPTPITPYTTFGGHAYAVPPGYETSPDWTRQIGGYTGTPDSSWPAAGLYPFPGTPSPNTYCPSATLPLAAHDKSVIDNYIDNELRAFNMGWGVEGTFSQSALAWAYRLLTPALPFAAPPKTASRDKVIVLMTDGLLYQSRSWVTRTGFGYVPEKRLINTDDDNDAARIAATNALEARMKRLCVMAKREGIVIYTVTFKIPSSDPRAQAYKDCASDPSKYFSPTDAATLKDAFTEIASNLASIRIVK